MWPDPAFHKLILHISLWPWVEHEDLEVSTPGSLRDDTVDVTIPEAVPNHKKAAPWLTQDLLEYRVVPVQQGLSGQLLILGLANDDAGLSSAAAPV